jgi:hypothetical protein
MSATADGLEIVTSAGEAGVVVLTLKGNADALSLTALNAAVERMHALALEGHARRAVVDLRNLEFMNSSCFKTFVTWLGKIRALAAAEQYRVEFQSDPRWHWQRRSLAALSAFGGDTTVITVHGKSPET